MYVITKTTIKRSNTLFLNEGMYLGFGTYKNSYHLSLNVYTFPSETLMIKITLPIPN